MSEHTQAVLEHAGSRANVIIRTAGGINVGSVEFMRGLEDLVDELAADRKARLVVLQGEGKVFLAGANIKAMADYDPDQARDMAELGHRVLNKLAALSQATVAAVNGAALGGGCELAMACDFRFAVKKASFGQPEVWLGLIPGWGGTIRLPRLVPLSQAKRMLFTGEAISAERALQIGLVDEVVEDAAGLEAKVEELRAKLGRSGPAALTHLKRALRTGDEIDSFTDCFTGAESKEGMTAFLEKRKASWAE
ncbi:MAG: enoyl-CoA hydratase/isomerase family protein [Planctomycetes bacterium]|nr:enoyl-CoA hydratase/isomerase family protein [Planctomycetota bacterium]